MGLFLTDCSITSNLLHLRGQLLIIFLFTPCLLNHNLITAESDLKLLPFCSG